MQNKSRQLASILSAAVTAALMGAPAFAQDLLVTGQTTPFTADKNDGITGPVAVPDDGTLEQGLPPDYEDTGLTIIDHNTGLEWEKKNSKDNIENLDNLHDADNVYLWSGNGTQETIWDWLEDVNAEGFAGHNDWQIPNVKQLESIVDYNRQTPAINPIFGPTAIHTYWTSTTQLGKQTQCFGINFENGRTITLLKGSIFKWVRAVRIAANPPPVSDLVETAVTNPPGSIKRGNRFFVTDTVKNQGTATAGASTTRYYLSLDTLKDSGDKLLTGSRAVPSLAPGAQSSGTVNVIVPSTTALGSYFLLACADDTLVVTENNETNNCKASATQVTVTP